MARVRLLGGLAEAAGTNEVKIAAAGVRELISRLAEIGGGQTASLLYEGYEEPDSPISRDLRVLVNGRDVDFLGGGETKLEEEDRVTVYLHGGRGFPGG